MEGVLYMIELTLAYAGAMLIGFEFIRKLRNFQTMLVLLAVWPLSPLLNAFPVTEKERTSSQWRRSLTSMSKFKVLYGVLMVVMLLPVPVLSLTVYLVTELVNIPHRVVNLLYRMSLDRFQPFATKLTRLIIERNKMYKGISSKKVVENMKKTELPFLPIVGVILITIAFIMQVA